MFIFCLHSVHFLQLVGINVNKNKIETITTTQTFQGSKGMRQWAIN